MIIVMKPHAPEEAVKRVAGLVQEKGLETHLSQGKEVTIIGVVGDKTKLSNENLTMLPWVDKLVPITESYKLSNRKFHPEPSRVKVKEHEIGPDTLTIMAGPCAVENEEQLMTIAREVKKSGAQFVRGGAFSGSVQQVLNSNPIRLTKTKIRPSRIGNRKGTLPLSGGTSLFCKADITCQDLSAYRDWSSPHPRALSFPLPNDKPRG